VNPYVLAFLGLFGTSEPSPPPTCPSSGTEVVVKATTPGSTVDSTQPRSVIAGMMKAAPYEGFAMQGLTVLDFSSSFRLQVTLSQIAPGRWCASAERIEASFGLTGPARILIAREIDPRSCQYRTVLAHERQHVSVGERNARDGALAMRRKLEELAAGRFPVEASTKDAAYDRASAMVEKAVSEVSAVYVERADRQNMAMDTVESYRRLSAKCG